MAEDYLTDDEQLEVVKHAFVEYAPWIIGEHTFGNVVAQPWLRGFKPDPLLRYQWKFHDVAAHARDLRGFARRIDAQPRPEILVAEIRDHREGAAVRVNGEGACPAEWPTDSSPSVAAS